MHKNPGFNKRIAVIAGACLLAFGAPAAAQDFLLTSASTAVLQKPLNRGERQAILAALAQAPSHGLPVYPVDEESSDTDLSRAIIDYAGALHGARMTAKFPSDWHLHPDPFDAAGSFQQAVQHNKLKRWLSSLAPRAENYENLRAALARYREIEMNGGWQALDQGPTLKVGSKGPRVVALRERLNAEYQGPAPEGDPATFDPSLSEYLKTEQARLGLPETGALDKATLAALNVPVGDRIDTLVANLERERWLPGKMPDYRIEVNLPAFWLDVWRNGERPLSMKIIDGRPHDPTPMFSDVMDAVVLNPPWNVPDNIARNEIWPKAKKDKAYLARNDYVVTSDGGLMQKAGPKSALGKIKFDLTNPFAIYLHDTPSRSLFQKDMRAFSHGCMRVEKPRDLAGLILADDRHYTPQVIDETIASGDTVRVDIARPVPVFVLYRTAFLGDDGRVQFRNDLYGWDAKLNDILTR
ncbi:MAG: L,D-transpeptidase family protein [Parcubacteria group bacterium]